MTVNLVNWPLPNGQYRNTGEGGLFAYAVWLDPRAGNACMVDTFPLLSMPDVFLSDDEGSARREQYWPLPDDANADYSPVSIPFVGTLLLGSTGNSLWDDRQGCYFAVSREHLTRDAQALMSTLDAVYGQSGRILTFLDT